MRQRAAKRLLLAFFGEFVHDTGVGPVRAGVIIEALDGAGIAAPTVRATLDRMAADGLLERRRVGREIEFQLTSQAHEVLQEGARRVHEPRPFDPRGAGWTLVTFSVPEGQRALRHRIRAVLGWEGFALLRDGLWLAPGDVDLAAVLEPLRHDLPLGAVTAFRAEELEGFPLAEALGDAWSLSDIRAAHDGFLSTWSDEGAADGADRALSARIMLVADWLALLRADPRLPPQLLGDDWPAEQSYAVYRARRAELFGPAEAEFSRLMGARVAV
ncbi:PaaX family transcriptional regulator C-terminal domain-containing protein [Microbacter sp. GSS18]|nr:PaaX family transcriptional regulator C-terminal domain-containing protein [Microbacter sp. GSS18]